MSLGGKVSGGHGKKHGRADMPKLTSVWKCDLLACLPCASGDRIFSKWLFNFKFSSIDIPDLLLAPTGLPAVRSRVDFEWGWEKTPRQGGRNATCPTSLDQGTSDWWRAVSICYLPERFPIFYYIFSSASHYLPVSMRREFWKKSEGRSVTNNQPKRAGRRRKSISTG